MKNLTFPWCSCHNWSNPSPGQTSTNTRSQSHLRVSTFGNKHRRSSGETETMDWSADISWERREIIKDLLRNKGNHQRSPEKQRKSSKLSWGTKETSNTLIKVSTYSWLQSNEIFISRSERMKNEEWRTATPNHAMHYIVSFSSFIIAMIKEENERPDENNILPSQRELLWTTHDHLYSWKASFASFAILGSHI